MSMLRRVVPVVLGVCALTACTPTQITKWVEWWEQDPAAAEAFAHEPWVQENLRMDTDRDGVVEPDAPEPDWHAGDTPDSPDPETSGGGTVWDRVANCESGGNWSIETGNGYSGGLQFAYSTWRAYGGQEFAARASQASRSQQIIVAERVLDDVGWGAWPTCSRRLGLR